MQRFGMKTSACFASLHFFVISSTANVADAR